MIWHTIKLSTIPIYTMPNTIKNVVTRPDKETLIRNFWLGRVTTVPGINILPDAETVIHMKEQIFARPRKYFWHTVVQRCIVVANQAWEILVTESAWSLWKSIITVGRWNLLPEELLAQKLPHITPVDTYGHGDFWILNTCETDRDSGMLFLWRILLTHQVGIFGGNADSLAMSRTLSWETPESLYKWKTLNTLQRSILLWMKHKFG